MNKLLNYIFLIAIFVSCGDIDNKFSVYVNTKNDVISNNDTLRLSINNPKDVTIDSIKFKLNNKIISSVLPLTNITLGEKLIKANIYCNGKSEVVTAKIVVLNSKVPAQYKYEIINSYPHNIESYTQGLEFYKNILYESTGQYGQSKLSALDYKNNTIIKSIDLNRSYFGEGLTVLNDKIYQLTWQNGKGFIYDVNSFELLEIFAYGQSQEGWGLCNDGNKLYKTDGTENVWILSPESLQEESFFQVYTQNGKLEKLNELEWVDGKIYANRYQKDAIVIIDPKNGAVDAFIDFSELKNQLQNPKIDVMNGIAYNTTNKTLFVTGKYWDKIFEVRIIKPQSK